MLFPNSFALFICSQLFHKTMFQGSMSLISFQQFPYFSTFIFHGTVKEKPKKNDLIARSQNHVIFPSLTPQSQNNTMISSHEYVKYFLSYSLCMIRKRQKNGK